MRHGSAPTRNVKQHLVKDWMTAKVLTVSPETSLTSADVTMEARRIRRLLVVEDGTLKGVVSDGDVRSALAKGTPEGDSEQSVADVMTPDPITMSEHATIGLAAQTMLSAKISGLPVVDAEGVLCGVLTESDIFRFVIHITQGGD